MVLHDLRHVDQHADQGPAADQGPDHQGQVDPADPAGLDELGHLDARRPRPPARAGRPASAFLPRRVRAATGSRAARCRNGRAPTRASVGSAPDGGGDGPLRAGHHRPRRPGWRPVSRSSWSVGGHRRRPPGSRRSRPRPWSSTTMVSVDSAPWAMPRRAAGSASWPKMSSRVSSARTGAGGRPSSVGAVAPGRGAVTVRRSSPSWLSPPLPSPSTGGRAGST